MEGEEVGAFLERLALATCSRSSKDLVKQMKLFSLLISEFWCLVTGQIRWARGVCRVRRAPASGWLLANAPV